MYKIKENPVPKNEVFGAGDEARTRYLHLGKVALYRMSYTRITRCIITGNLNLSIAFLRIFPLFYFFFPTGDFTGQ